MGLSTHKFKESDFSLKKIADLSDTPSSDGMTAAELKARFDDIPKNMIALGNFNNLVDNLVSLNLDNIVGDIDDRYTKELTEKRLSEETNSLIESITFDSTDGSFKITTKDGNTKTIDTDLEKIPAKLTLETEGDVTYLVITNQDGSTTKTDVTKLLNVYTFTDGSTITFTENPQYKVTAEVAQNSIKKEHFSSEVTAYLEDLEASAKNSATAAAGSEKNSETSAVNSSSFMTQSQSYAIGGTGTRTGEDTDNAKYYSEQSNKDYTTLSAEIAEQAEKIENYKTFFATYGTTTFAEVKAAVSAGKDVILKVPDDTSTKPIVRYAQLMFYREDAALFTASVKDTYTGDRWTKVTPGPGGGVTSGGATVFTEDNTYLSYSLDSEDNWSYDKRTIAFTDSPALTGTPTAPTPDASDSSTRLATTEFVDNTVTDNLGGLVFSVTADGLLHIEQKEG